MFIQPVVITVRKNCSVKIALDAKTLNNAILKNEYPKPNLESLMEKVAEIIGEKRWRGIFHISRYAIRIWTNNATPGN